MPNGSSYTREQLREIKQKFYPYEADFLRFAKEKNWEFEKGHHDGAIWRLSSRPDDHEIMRSLNLTYLLGVERRIGEIIYHPFQFNVFVWRDNTVYSDGALGKSSRNVRSMMDRKEFETGWDSIIQVKIYPLLIASYTFALSKTIDDLTTIESGEKFEI